MFGEGGSGCAGSSENGGREAKTLRVLVLAGQHDRARGRGYKLKKKKSSKLNSIKICKGKIR